MGEAHLTIKEAGSDLVWDENKNILCPFCVEDYNAQGKPSNWKPYESLSIGRKPAGIIYYCHRATCTRGNKGGLVSDTLTRKGRQPKKDKFVVKECIHPMERLTGHVYKEMVEPFYISLEEAEKQGFKWLSTENRLYMPTYNKSGYVIGGTAKTIVKKLKPKSIQYRHANVSMIHYPKQREQDYVILVEDTLSAVRLVVAGYPAAALLGTNITDEMLKQLIEQEKNVTLALDGDASMKSINYKKKIGMFFKNFRLVLLSNRDMKELTDEELEKLLCSI